MAIDWGDIIDIGGDIVDWFSDDKGTNGYTPVPRIPVTPTYSTVTDPRRQHCKRRRRRRLLTESDFNDLMRIATLPNKQNVAVALAKAVGRRS